MTERNASMLRLMPGPVIVVELVTGSGLRVVLVVVAVVQRRLGPSSSATTSTADLPLPLPQLDYWKSRHSQ
jgi:hypothetical protein